MRESMEHLQTEPLVIRREWAVDGIPVLTAVVTVPRPVEASGRTARRIARFYRLQGRAYLRYCDRFLFPQAKAEYQSALASGTPLPCFQGELTYFVTYNEGGLWSLYTQSREVTFPGQPLLCRHGDTWDLAAGFPVSAGDFFAPRTAWKRHMLKLAAEEIRRQERAGAATYRSDWQRALRRSFNSRNYYLTAEGLVFFYPMYTLAPAEERIPAFLFPYSEDGPKLSFTRG